MRFEKAVLNREANCLSIFFVCREYPRAAVRDDLEARFVARFPGQAVRF